MAPRQGWDIVYHIQSDKKVERYENNIEQHVPGSQNTIKTYAIYRC